MTWLHRIAEQAPATEWPVLTPELTHVEVEGTTHEDLVRVLRERGVPLPPPLFLPPDACLAGFTVIGSRCSAKA